MAKARQGFFEHLGATHGLSLLKAGFKRQSWANFPLIRKNLQGEGFCTQTSMVTEQDQAVRKVFFGTFNIQEHMYKGWKKESLLNNAFSGITKTGISAAEICQCDSLWKRPCPPLGEHNLLSKHVSWFATATRLTHSLSHCRIPCVLSQCHKEPKAAWGMKLPLCLQIDIPSLRMKPVRLIEPRAVGMRSQTLLSLMGRGSTSVKPSYWRKRFVE